MGVVWSERSRVTQFYLAREEERTQHSKNLNSLLSCGAHAAPLTKISGQNVFFLRQTQQLPQLNPQCSLRATNGGVFLLDLAVRWQQSARLAAVRDPVTAGADGPPCSDCGLRNGSRPCSCVRRRHNTPATSAAGGEGEDAQGQRAYDRLNVGHIHPNNSSTDIRYCGTRLTPHTQPTATGGDKENTPYIVYEHAVVFFNHSPENPNIFCKRIFHFYVL